MKASMWNVITELTDKNILGLDGMSSKLPRLTSRAIVINEEGKCAVCKQTQFVFPSGWRY